MPLGTEVGLGLRDIVLDGDPAPPPLYGHSPPKFLPIVRCGKRLDGLRCHLVWSQTSAQATVFDGDRATPRKKGTPTPHPIFSPCLL